MTWICEKNFYEHSLVLDMYMCMYVCIWSPVCWCLI